MSIFENATRQKLRFKTVTGLLSVEDLWDLPLQSKTPGKANLDAIAIALSKELEQTAPVSFVDASASSTVNADIRLKLDVTLHIIKTKMAENKAAAELAAARKQDQVILGALAKREMDELLALPTDQLRARLSARAASTETATEGA